MAPEEDRTADERKIYGKDSRQCIEGRGLPARWGSFPRRSRHSSFDRVRIGTSSPSKSQGLSIEGTEPHS